MSDETMTPADELDLRAAEYVLGTLAGPERTAFEAELGTKAEAREAVQRWEARLMPLTLAMKPEDVDPAVWEALSRRIGNGTVEVMRPRAAPLLKAWAAMATAASVALAAMLVLQPPPPTPEPIIQVHTVEKPVLQTVYVAYLKMADVDMHWTVSAVPESGQLKVTAGGTPPAGASGKSPELWWLGEGGPVSMGVIPVTGEQAASLPATVGELHDHQLAVSLEPAGGSPTGQPTGPVIAVSPVVKAF